MARDLSYPRTIMVRLHNDEDIKAFGKKIGRNNITVKTKQITYSVKQRETSLDNFL